MTSVPFIERVAALGRPELLSTCDTLDTLQINVGRRCNLQCKHCHVEAGPGRTEEMTSETIDDCLTAFRSGGFSVLDITGGAPELNPDYGRLVDAAAEYAKSRELPINSLPPSSRPICPESAQPLGAITASSDLARLNTLGANRPQSERQAINRHLPSGGKVITRTNLVILTLPDYAHLPGFWAERGVEVVGSLPSWEARNTDRQRGEGVFERAIEGLRRLNAAGYGQGGSNADGQPLTLNLVLNPGGAFLPPPQASAEREFKAKLSEYGISFDNLLTITNNPLGRFGDFLAEKGKLDAYMKRLTDAFNPGTVENMMCRSQLSVSWDGRLYDCDFNQAADLAAAGQNTITEVARQGAKQRPLRLGDHCYACTAGAGSSCGGATAG
jgi:radical SAM/Cys-rich protein